MSTIPTRKPTSIVTGSAATPARKDARRQLAQRRVARPAHERAPSRARAARSSAVASRRCTPNGIAALPIATTGAYGSIGCSIAIRTREPSADAIEDLALLDGGFHLDDARHRAREPQRAGVVQFGNRGQVPGDAARRDASPGRRACAGFLRAGSSGRRTSTRPTPARASAPDRSRRSRLRARRRERSWRASILRAA